MTCSVCVLYFLTQAKLVARAAAKLAPSNVLRSVAVTQQAGLTTAAAANSAVVAAAGSTTSAALQKQVLQGAPYVIACLCRVQHTCIQACIPHCLVCAYTVWLSCCVKNTFSTPSSSNPSPSTPSFLCLAAHTQLLRGHSALDSTALLLEAVLPSLCDQVALARADSSTLVDGLAALLQQLIAARFRDPLLVTLVRGGAMGGVAAAAPAANLPYTCAKAISSLQI